MNPAHEAKKFIAQISGGLFESCSRAKLNTPALTEDLIQVVYDAFALAAAMGEDATTCHLLVAAIRRPKIGIALAESGIDVKRLEANLPQPENLPLLDRILLKVVPQQEPAADQSLWRALLSAASLSIDCGRSQFGIMHVVLECLDSSSRAAEYLEDADADRLKIRRFISHGEKEYAVRLPAGVEPSDQVLIRILNDDYTSKEFVAEVLREYFQIPDADELTIKIHQGDDVRVGPFEAEMALGLVRRVYLAASTAEHPLRLELCKPSGSPSGK